MADPDLQKILEHIEAARKYAKESGFETLGGLIDAILSYDERQPTVVGWPPPFGARIEKVGDDDGYPVYELILTRIDRDLTSFEVDMTDFDPEGDGAVNLRWAVAGKKLAELNWFFGYDKSTGRYGAFQSSIREYDDNPSVYEEIVLMRFSMDADDEFTFYELGVSGNYDRGDGRGERHFTYHDFTDVSYTPD